jgi:uncharacterized protein
VTLYADASAVLKLYLDEDGSDAARDVLRRDPEWISACITTVEVRRNLARLPAGEELADAQAQFREDWSAVVSLAIDDASCERAATVAEQTGLRSLDALHLEAAGRAAGEGDLPIATFDRRLAEVARSRGWTVLGA